jgi:hypothetical protein
MKTDDPGFLDIKLAIVSMPAQAPQWLEALAALGDVEGEGEVSGWTERKVRTAAKLQDRTIRITGRVGPPTADAVAGYVGADALVTDGSTEIPEVSLANLPRTAGAPSRETLMDAIKGVLRTAAR